MNIGNPLKAIPRYAKIASAGFQNKPMPVQIPQRIGNADAFLYDRTQWAGQNRLMAGAGTVGAIAANQMLGNPLGGVADALTFGVTNFRPNAETGAEPASQTLIMQQPGMPPSPSQAGVPTQPMSLPNLNEEDRKRQLQYLQRKMATDLITMQGLQPQGGSNESY